MLGESGTALHLQDGSTMMHLRQMALAGGALVTLACSAHNGDVDSSFGSAAEAREAALKRLAVMDAAFEQEPRRAEWADGIERELNELFTEERHRSIELTSVLCKTTACRLEATQSFEQSGPSSSSPPVLVDPLESAVLKVRIADFSGWLMQGLDGFSVVYFFRRGRRPSAVETALHESVAEQK